MFRVLSMCRRRSLTGKVVLFAPLASLMLLLVIMFDKRTDNSAAPSALRLSGAVQQSQQSIISVVDVPQPVRGARDEIEAFLSEEHSGIHADDAAGHLMPVRVKQTSRFLSVVADGDSMLAPQAQHDLSGTLSSPTKNSSNSAAGRPETEDGGIGGGAGERAVLPPPQRPATGPGELGRPVRLPKNVSVDVQRAVDLGWMNNAFNQYVSDLVSLHRSLPEVRDHRCQEEQYGTSLPDTSVIICFHNEAWSVLLRTIHSVLDRSPRHLLNEIILVDDFSSMGWLEPLLARIAANHTTVVCPVIDVIDDTTLEYHFQPAAGTSVGGFDWNLQFNWHAVPERERQAHKSASEPVASPTMAGGLFAIDRQWFETLGTYDEGFDIWGGENLELSFKVWMCGGRLEIVPCSHVGHIFRKRSPYKWRSGVNVLRRNSIRLAEVWMDDYKKYYYQRIGSDLGDFGDVSSRKAIRQRLQCHSFEWYLDNIYPELFIPGDAVANGEIRNMKTSICVDSPTDSDDVLKSVGTFPCHKQGGNQFWMLSKTGEIRRDEVCLDYSGGADVVLYTCHGSKGNQEWIYDIQSQLLTHGSSRRCMAVSADKSRITMEECDSNNDRLRWKLENYDVSKL